jgi:hypothetical protein
MKIWPNLSKFRYEELASTATVLIIVLIILVLSGGGTAADAALTKADRNWPESGIYRSRFPPPREEARPWAPPVYHDYSGSEGRSESS